MRKITIGLLVILVAAISSLYGCQDSSPSSPISPTPPDKESPPDRVPLERKVLFLGNSMTHNGPDLKIGWNGSWGMAASAANKDYLSIMTLWIKQKNAKNQVLGQNVYAFEREFETIDLDRFKALKDFGADVIVIRFGENIFEENRAQSPELRLAVKKFIDYLSDQRKVQVIVTTPFWYNTGLVKSLTTLAKENSWPLVPLEDLGFWVENTAWGKFEDKGVAQHPGDLGMQRIAERIWGELEKML